LILVYLIRLWFHRSCIYLGHTDINILYPNPAGHQPVQHGFEEVLLSNRSVFLDAGIILFFGYKPLFFKKS